MSNVTLKGLAKPGARPREFIEEQFGISPTISGDDLVISDREAARAFAEAEVLHLHSRFELQKGKEWNHASVLYAQIPSDFKQFQPPPPSQIKISPDFGLISKVEEVSTLLAVVPEMEVVECLADRVIPTMVECYNVSHVTGVSINASYQQACISLCKIALLARTHKASEISDIIREKNPMGTVLPNSMDCLSYVDCLTRLSPAMFTLPIRRQGCSWHFQSRAMYWFGSDPVNGVAQQFMADFSPLADTAHFLGLEGLKRIDERFIFRLLRFCVVGINRLLSYVNDPRNFKSDDGSVDLFKQVQSYVAIQLIFADLAAINYSTHAHNRITYAMLAMDKIANLRLHLGKVQESESRLMVNLASFAQRDDLKKIIQTAASRLDYADFFHVISGLIDRCYETIHDHLRRQSYEDNVTEEFLLERIWLQRNVRHGAFLRKNSFERLFLAADGTVGSSIETLPFLLIFGLISDPARFLSYNPNLEGRG